MCLQGASRAGAGLLDGIAAPDLHAFFAWVPMVPSDTRERAVSAAERFAEPRAAHYWDGGRLLAARMARALAIGARESIGVDGEQGFAWDVYLAYGRGAADLEHPNFWMHQLQVSHAPRLDAADFHRRVADLLRVA